MRTAFIFNFTTAAFNRGGDLDDSIHIFSKPLLSLSHPVYARCMVAVALTIRHEAWWSRRWVHGVSARRKGDGEGRRGGEEKEGGDLAPTTICYSGASTFTIFLILIIVRQQRNGLPDEGIAHHPFQSEEP